MARGPHLEMPQGLSSLAARRSIKNSQQGWYRIVNSADGGPAEVFIYGEIVDEFEAELLGMGVSAVGFVRELQGLRGQALDVHVNSPGGLLWDGIAVYNAIRQHSGHVRTINDGMAASVASVIMMAGDERVLAPHSIMMIHDALGMTVGNAADHQMMVDRLNKFSEEIAAIYHDRGDKRVNWRAKMQAETWFKDSEAVAVGLADRIDKGITNQYEAIKNTVDLSVFRSVPSMLRGPMNLAEMPPSEEEEAEETETHEPTIRDAERALTALGMSDKRAKAVLAVGWKDAARDESVSDEAESTGTVEEPSEEPAEQEPPDELAQFYAKYSEIKLPFPRVGVATEV